MTRLKIIFSLDISPKRRLDYLRSNTDKFWGLRMISAAEFGLHVLRKHGIGTDIHVEVTSPLINANAGLPDCQFLVTD